MSGGGPPRPDPAHASSAELPVLRLHKEDFSVSKRIRKTLVRAARTTTTRDSLVEQDLCHEHVVVERVAIGRVVDSVPPTREDGDVTILSVVEETLVVVRQLILKEEVHLRRVKVTERHVETVTLREQGVVVTRTDLPD